MKMLRFRLMHEDAASGSPVFVAIDPDYVIAVETRQYARIGNCDGVEYAVIVMADGTKYTVEDQYGKRIDLLIEGTKSK